jgi:hypothetical protein
VCEEENRRKEVKTGRTRGKRKRQLPRKRNTGILRINRRRRVRRKRK